MNQVRDLDRVWVGVGKLFGVGFRKMVLVEIGIDKNMDGVDTILEP